MRRCWNWYTSWSKKPVPWHESSSLSRRTIDIGSVTEVVERYGLQHHWRNPTWVRIPPDPPKIKKEGDLHMFLDKRNKNKVIIVKESPDGKSVIVRELKSGKRYLVGKENLKEILVDK